MNSPVRRATLLCSLALACSLTANGQSGNEGSIAGIVMDGSGAVVPGTSVKLRQYERAASFVSITDASGLFRFPILPIGTYELTAECKGFDLLVEKNLQVTVGGRINLSLSLSLASKSESVVVATETPLIESTRSQMSFILDNRAVTSLPVNGRNFLDFALLTPAVSRDAKRVGDLSFAGQRGMNSVLVDGVDDNNTFFGPSLGRVGPDRAPFQFSLAAVQEFQVNTNAYSAEFGRAAGGVINMVTHSGTDEFHGSVFWHYRDRAMNANDAVNKLNSLLKPPYHFHQFGGTLGGPVVKNKLFFFTGFDGQRSALANVVFLNLPSGFQLNSDPTIAGLQRQALSYLAARGASWLRTFDENVYFAKLDWRINPSHVLTARWNRQRFTGGGNEGRGPQISLERTGTALSKTDTLALSLTSTLSGSMVNVARFSYVRSRSRASRTAPTPKRTFLKVARSCSPSDVIP